MAADRRANSPVADLIKRWQYRQNIIARDKDPKVAELRKRYIEEEMVQSRALELYEQFKSAGVSWDACVFAVKTDWVSSFLNKWGEKKRLVKEAEAASNNAQPRFINKNKHKNKPKVKDSKTA